MASITVKQLAEYAVDELESGKSIESVSKSLAAFLLKERRTRESSTLFRAVESELTQRGKTQVTIISAREVSDEFKKQLANLLNVENPVFNEIIDENVIGGVKARADELEIDLTVRGKLNRFKQQVINSN